MTQGANLPSLHTWNIGSTVYVDQVNGSDVTGTGATGAPYKTLQKVADVLAASFTWPALGSDLKVAIRAGTYQAASGVNTLLTAFSTSARAPAATRFLIWAPDTGHDGLVKIKNPTGTDTDKGCITIGSNALNSYQIFSDLELDGEGVRKGAGGNGTSFAIYWSGTTADSNTMCEAINLRVHSFKANAPTQPSTAQGIDAEAGATFLKVYRCSVSDMGTNTLTTANQEHGMYIRADDCFIGNTEVYDCQNGYNLQFFNGSAVFHRQMVVNSTFDNANSSGITIPGDSTSCTFANNIFTNHTLRGSTSHGFNFGAPSTGVGTANLLDHSVYFNNTTNRSATPTGWTITNEKTADPGFIGTKNHRLSSAASPAAGYADTNYSPAIDILGTTRPAGAEDAGAFEFVAGNQNIVVNALAGGCKVTRINS